MDQTLDVEELLIEIDRAEQALKPSLDKYGNAARKLLDEAVKITESWSGSYCGYHSELFYGDFEKPPFAGRFSPEWGGLHGIPAGYHQRTPDEVKDKIEHLAGCTFSDVERGTATAIDSLRTV